MNDKTLDHDTAHHGVDLKALTIPQLKLLVEDTPRELAERTEKNKAEVERKLREVVEAAGLDPGDYLKPVKKKRGRKPRSTNIESEE